jgi:hypothetical protein
LLDNEFKKKQRKASCFLNKGNYFFIFNFQSLAFISNIAYHHNDLMNLGLPYTFRNDDGFIFEQKIIRLRFFCVV